MSNLNLAPYGIPQYFDADGNPLSGGQMYTFKAGELNPLATYQDSLGAVPNANPIQLNASGRPDTGNGVWLLAQAYKFVLADSSANTIWTLDNVQGQGGGGGSSGRVYNLISDLRAAPDGTIDGEQAWVGGYRAEGDGGEGWYHWSVSSTATDNWGTVVTPSDSPSLGRWLRTFESTINVKWFGAYGTGTTDDYTYFHQAILAAHGTAPGSKNFPITIPAGYYKLMSDPGFSTSTSSVAANTAAIMQPGAILWVAASYSMGIPAIISDIGPHFDTLSGSFGGSVYFVNLSDPPKGIQTGLTDIRPEWFGAVGAFSVSGGLAAADNAPMINAAIFAAGNQGTVMLGDLYGHVLPIVVGNVAQVVGAGPLTGLCGPGSGSTGVGGITDSTTYLNGVVLRNFNLSQETTGVNLANLTGQVTIRDLSFDHDSTAVNLGSSIMYPNLDGVTVTDAAPVLSSAFRTNITNSNIPNVTLSGSYPQLTDSNIGTATFNSSPHAIVTGNKLTYVNLNTSSGAVISGNVISNSVRVTSSTDSAVSGNTIIGADVSISASSGSAVTGNIFQTGGINVGTSNFVSIVGNSVAYQISVANDSSSCVVLGNTVPSLSAMTSGGGNIVAANAEGSLPGTVPVGINSSERYKNITIVAGNASVNPSIDADTIIAKGDAAQVNLPNALGSGHVFYVGADFGNSSHYAYINLQFGNTWQDGQTGQIKVQDRQMGVVMDVEPGRWFVGGFGPAINP